MSVKETIWEIEPHTEAKHAILRKYLDAWLPILAQSKKRVVFIDGFAGPGEYVGGKDGSPVIAIKAVIEHKIKLKSELCFLFIEKDKKRFDFLENKLKTMKLPPNIKYECRCGEFADVITSVLDKLKREGSNLAPSLVFIDPFGFKGLPFNIIKKLMKNKGCEVLINFMFGSVNRFIDNPQNEQTCNELFGSEEWKKLKKIDNERERRRELHELYKKQLKTVSDYVTSFQMINKFNQTEYFLFFATNHILGLKKMKESMWRMDPGGSFEFSDATYDPNQTVLFGKEPNFVLLKKLILGEYKGKKVSINELENFVVVNTPFRESHFRTSILKEMEENKTINVFSKEKRRTGTYPEGTVIEFL